MSQVATNPTRQVIATKFNTTASTIQNEEFRFNIQGFVAFINTTPSTQRIAIDSSSLPSLQHVTTQVLESYLNLSTSPLQNP